MVDFELEEIYKGFEFLNVIPTVSKVSFGLAPSIDGKRIGGSLKRFVIKRFTQRAEDKEDCSKKNNRALFFGFDGVDVNSHNDENPAP